jgi:hypothetical protein
MALSDSSRLAFVNRATLSTLLFTLMVSPAFADLILVESAGEAGTSLQFFGAGLPDVADIESFGPFGGVAIAEVGQNRAVQTGSGLNAVSAFAQLSDIPSFVSHAGTAIDWTIEKTGPGFEDLVFEYTINGGEVRLFDPAGSFAGLRATVAASIFTLAPDVAGFLWEWGVTLRGESPGVVVASVHGFASIFPLDDPLGLGIPTISAVTISGPEAFVSIAPFTATVNLGPMSQSSVATITYSMYGEVAGPAFNLTGGKATVGDPFNLQGSPGSSLSFNGQTPAVPEPSTLALTGLGLLFLARRTRRRAGRRDLRSGE